MPEWRQKTEAETETDADTDAEAVTAGRAGCDTGADASTPTWTLARTGFHASDEDAYAATLDAILRLSPAEALAVRQAARARAQRVFSVPAFERAFAYHIWSPLQDKMLAQTRKSQ